MDTKYTVTIGIPAFNEEANIGYLLEEILKLEDKTYVLENIIVVSDGSADKTVEIATKYQVSSSKIKILDEPDRQGKFARMNQLSQISESDILIVLDADIMIIDNTFVDDLIMPILENNCDMTSATQIEMKPTNFLGKILFEGAKLKEQIYNDINNGNNIYTCHGHSRAFSKKLYKSMKYSKGVGEDAFSYLYCVSNGYKYCFARQAKVKYKLPENYTDHKNQSVRYFLSHKRLSEEFGEAFVQNCYKIPISIAIKNILASFIKNPVYISLYILIVAFMRIRSIFSTIPVTWVMSTSTKNLRGTND